VNTPHGKRGYILLATATATATATAAVLVSWLRT
jgi:hypothetical protein